jgi:3-phenylpropionate/trans-cinnamate dioxygenase ferredoxin subunit
MTGWHAVAKMGDLSGEEPFPCEVNGTKLALFLLDGEVYATSNVCTHAYALLSDGLVEGDTVECPLHNARFDIRTGKALTSPAEEALKTFETRTDDEVVLVRVASGTDAKP